MSEMAPRETLEVTKQASEGIREINGDCRELAFLDCLPDSDSGHCDCGCQACCVT